MSFELIDYSYIYYKKIKEIAVPRKRTGKFVQILDEAEAIEYVVLSPKELSVYHANIVERFCAMKKIEGSYNGRKDHFAVRSGAWDVAGGGLWEIDQDKKTLELCGTSKAYGPFMTGGLRDRILASGALRSYAITVTG